MRLLLLVVSMGVASPALADAAVDVREIRGAAQAFDDAQLHADRAALDRLLAPDFLLVGASGTVIGRREVLDGYADAGARLDAFDATDPLLLRPSADVAIVGEEVRARGMDRGTRFSRHFRVATTFVRRGGQWLAVFSQLTTLP